MLPNLHFIENLGDYITKKPNLKNLNINAETLEKLKEIAKDTGIPYQRLINHTLADSLAAKTKANSK